jgi:hypothetical protein
MKTTSTHRQAGRHRLPLDGGGQRGHAAGCLSFSDHSDDPGGQCPAAHRHPALHRRIRPRGPGPGPRQDHPHHHRLPAGRQRGVPYKGTDPMVADLLGGHVAVGVNPVADVADHHRAGKLKVLAAPSARRCCHRFPRWPNSATRSRAAASSGMAFSCPKDAGHHRRGLHAGAQDHPGDAAGQGPVRATQLSDPCPAARGIRRRDPARERDLARRGGRDGLHAARLTQPMQDPALRAGSLV